jgi:tetratricopeptide (TPR) repeat protein
MTRTLAQLLALPRAWNVIECAHVDRALAHPATVDEVAAAALPTRGRFAPAATVASPLLLAANDAGGSLWTLASPNAPAHPEAVRLHEESARAYEHAGRRANSALPLVADPMALWSRGIPHVVPVSPPPEGVGVVRGESFGLAFFLAHVSRALGVPIPADVAATAAIAPDGSLCAVDCLEQKVDVLVRWAPAVRRLLVAAEQTEEAAECVARRVGAGVRVIGLRRDDDAWPEVFDPSGTELEGALQARWSERAVASRAARAIFRFSLTHPPFNLNWKGVGRTADLLVQANDGSDRWRAAVAAAIAWRHANAPRPLGVEDMPRDLRHLDRMTVLIHGVQAANDDVSGDWRAVAARAEQELPAPDREGREDLKLLGALGRLYASWGELERARELLWRAVAIWCDLDEFQEASYPLAEWFRVIGLMGDVEELHRFDVPPEVFAGRGGPYVRLSRGRAYVLCGMPERARVDLDGTHTAWNDTPLHLQASRARWLARIENREGALRTLAEFVRRDAQEARFAWCLARVDAGEAGAADALTDADARQYARCRDVAQARPGHPAQDWFPY